MTPALTKVTKYSDNRKLFRTIQKNIKELDILQLLYISIDLSTLLFFLLCFCFPIAVAITVTAAIAVLATVTVAVSVASL